MDLIEELYATTDVLSAAQIDYAICGGLAVAIHGRPRMTVDIDLLIPSEQITSAVDAVAKIGFDDVTGWVVLPSSTLGIERLYRVNKFAGNNFLTLDLLEVDSTSNPIFRSRQAFKIANQVIHVLSRDALITMKANTGRTQDKLDVELLQRDIEHETE